MMSPLPAQPAAVVQRLPDSPQPGYSSEPILPERAEIRVSFRCGSDSYELTYVRGGGMSVEIPRFNGQPVAPARDDPSAMSDLQAFLKTTSVIGTPNPLCAPHGGEVTLSTHPDSRYGKYGETTYIRIAWGPKGMWFDRMFTTQSK